MQITCFIHKLRTPQYCLKPKGLYFTGVCLIWFVVTSMTLGLVLLLEHCVSIMLVGLVEKHCLLSTFGVIYWNI